jgi:hypothetical protein
MFSHACVFLFLTSTEIFFRSNAQQFYYADTHSSLPLGQTPAKATRATPAKRVTSSTSSPDDLHILRRYKTSKQWCARNIVRSMASLWSKRSRHQKLGKIVDLAAKPRQTIGLSDYPLSYGVPVRERYGSTLLPATREQHDQNCTQSH